MQKTWRKDVVYTSVLEAQMNRIVPTNYANFNRLIADALKLLEKYETTYVFNIEHVEAIQKVIPNIKYSVCPQGIFTVERMRKKR